jgi:hypothetical protein
MDAVLDALEELHFLVFIGPRNSRIEELPPDSETGYTQEDLEYVRSMLLRARDQMPHDVYTFAIDTVNALAKWLSRRHYWVEYWQWAERRAEKLRDYWSELAARAQ